MNIQIFSFIQSVFFIIHTKFHAEKRTSLYNSEAWAPDATVIWSLKWTSIDLYLCDIGRSLGSMPHAMSTLNRHDMITYWPTVHGCFMLVRPSVSSRSIAHSFGQYGRRSMNVTSRCCRLNAYDDDGQMCKLVIETRYIYIYIYIYSVHSKHALSFQLGNTDWLSYMWFHMWFHGRLTT